MRLALVLALGATACDHERASGMVVSVQKQTPAGCYATIDGTTPAPELGLDPCTTDAPGIVAGLDRLRFVIDYGQGVDVSAGTEVPEPDVVVTLGGNASPVGVRFEPVDRIGERVHFLALYDVPAVAASGLQVAVEAAPDLTGVTKPLPVALPKAAVRVQDCPSMPCTLEGGATSASVEVTIPSRTGQEVSLRSTLRGIARNDARDLTTVTVGEGITAVTATMEIPFVDEPGVWTIEARWIGEPVTTTVSLIRPTIGVAIEECPSPEPCEQIAGVGTVRAAVTIPGDSAQSATLRSIVDNSVVSELPVNTTVLPGHVTRASVPVPVPFATHDALWRLDLVWKTITTPSTAVALSLPVVTSTIGCGAPCTVTAGAPVQLVIAAPRNIQTSSALFRTSTGAAPPLEGVISQFTIDEAAATRVWRTTLTAPAAGTTWQIDASVAGYPATTLLATVTP